MSLMFCVISMSFEERKRKLSGMPNRVASSMHWPIGTEHLASAGLFAPCRTPGADFIASGMGNSNTHFPSGLWAL